ncbi:hypothetical protein V1517DRAFT_131522 [Lipomyces orientalis]|uniref:Uncharacterized protein n=1 Tax=Lipomyces orientalis TaxID=1233043 RepID=A0ACC3TNB0_9ASCO
MKGEDQDFAESSPWLGLDPAPVPTNPLSDLPDSIPLLASQPEMTTSSPVRLLSSPLQEESRSFSSMYFSADSDDLCFGTLDRRQEALDSALSIQPRQEGVLSGSDDVSATSDEVFSPSPLSKLASRQEMRVLPMSSQLESFSRRPSLPCLGFAMTNQVQQFTARRLLSQREGLNWATQQPVDIELLPESKVDFVHCPSGPVHSKTAVEIHAEPKMRNFDIEIAAAKLRMAEIFKRAKKTFVQVKPKLEPTGINDLTPIGAVTSSIKYLVANTTNVAMARHNWDLAVLTARMCMLSARQTTWSAVARETQLRNLVIDVSKLRSGMNALRQFETAPSRLQTSRDGICGPCNEENLSCRSNLSNVRPTWPSTNAIPVLHPLLSGYQEHQQDSANNNESSEDDEDTIIELSSSAIDEEGEDSVDTELSEQFVDKPIQIINQKDEAESLSMSHEIIWHPTVNRHAHVDSDASRLDNTEEYCHQDILDSKNIQDAVISIAPDEQDKFVGSSSGCGTVAISDSGIQQAGAFSCHQSHKSSQLGLTAKLQVSTKTEEDRVEKCSQPYSNASDSSPTPEAGDIDYIADDKDMDIEHVSSSLPDAADRGELDLNGQGSGKPDNPMHDDDASLNESRLLNWTSGLFCDMVCDAGRTHVDALSGDKQSSPLLVLPKLPTTRTRMAASDGIVIQNLPDFPITRVTAISTASMTTEPKDQLAQRREREPECQLQQTPLTRAPRLAIQITHNNDGRTIVRFLELPKGTAVLDCTPATDDQLQNNEIVFCGSVLPLDMQCEMSSVQIEDTGTVLINIGTQTNDDQVGAPKEDANGWTGTVPIENSSQSAEDKQTAWRPHSIVDVLLVVTLLVAMFGICGWISYNFLLLMGEVWEFLDRGMWYYLNPRERVQLLDEIYIKKARTFYLMARFVVANMKEYFGPRPRAFVT